MLGSLEGWLLPAREALSEQLRSHNVFAPSISNFKLNVNISSELSRVSLRRSLQSTGMRGRLGWLR